MKCPKIPVAGRLTYFLNEWEKITNDQWVLSIIKEGYKLEFLQKPKFQGIRETKVNLKDLDIITEEINSLLKKGAIEKVSRTKAMAGFYSTLFLVAKKNGEMRPVINLKPLNKYLRKQHFKMDTLTKVLNLVKQGDWAITLDLKDAYFHVGIFKKHRKFLRFCVQGQVYQFKALCFGPTSAPRVFTKIVSVVAAHLRSQNVRLAVYLDDWMSVNQEKQALLQDRELMLNLLTRLGFIINLEKSNLIPTQTITYLGALFKLKKFLVFPTQDRIQSLLAAVQDLMNGQITARHYLRVLGIIASCLELIPNARLFMRPLQIHLLQHWKPSKMSLDFQIVCTPKLRKHLKWWLSSANISKGRFLKQNQTCVTITTDASMTGWGGVMKSKTVQGLWSTEMTSQHINNLEMEAVFLTLKHFQTELTNKQVLVRSDNMSVVQYINKQGGTHSVQLCQQTWDLWLFALENQITLKSAHIAGVKNRLADQLSRTKVRPTEWELNSQIVQNIFQLWGQPSVDLFATYENKKTVVFCSWILHPQALAVDALSMEWNNLFAYAFPPLSLIPKVLQHMLKFQCEIILIAPHWPRQMWYPQLLQLLVDFPRKLPIKKDLLVQGKKKIEHPSPSIFNLTAWKLSTNIIKQKAFQTILESSCPPLGDQELKKITIANLGDTVAGVRNGILIPMQHL